MKCGPHFSHLNVIELIGHCQCLDRDPELCLEALCLVHYILLPSILPGSSSIVEKIPPRQSKITFISLRQKFP